MADFEANFVLGQQTEVNANFSVEVTNNDHAILVNRDAPDQHPISAITGLQEALDEIQSDYVTDAELEAALLEKQDVLTAGANIQIENGVISATDTTYTAGTGISIENGVISNTQTSAEWGNIGGDISAQTDLQDALSAKVNKDGDTMTGILKIRRSSGNEFLQIFPSVRLNEPPSTTRNIAMFVNYDTEGNAMAKALQNLGSDGSNTIKLTASKPWLGRNAGIEAGWDASGIAFATAPETSTRRTNYTDIITRGYLNTYKQDKLVSGTNIKTINNNSLLGSGNINLTASDVGALANTTTINDLTTTAQQNALNSGATTANIEQIATNASDISLINDKIPAQASSSNQLADKDFVNSSISTNTANFIGTFNSVAELEAYSGTLTNNDYAFVATTDTAGNTLYDRYKWNGSEWLFEYELNNSSFTAVQWAAINSGATTAVVELAQSALQPNDNISELNNDAGYITGITSSDVTSALGYTPQDTLVSGTNIKTINNVSLLGSGNLEIGGTIDTEISTSSTNAVQNKAIANYIVSRGENLVSNGFATLGNNYNFKSFVYDGADTYGAGGCFSVTSTPAGSRSSILTNELMPVDITQSYKLSYAVKNSTSTSTYDYLNMYDIDGYTIAKGNATFVSGTTTTLAQELKNGDTKVYLTNISDTWHTGDPSVSTNQYYRGLIFWNYQNSYGYQYPIEYYSRNWWYNLWNDDNDVDKVNGVITLKSAWNNGTFPAGTPVSQSNTSGGYTYGNANYIPPIGEWTEKSFIFTPDRFMNGTSYVRLGWLYNYSQRPSNVFKISSVSLTQNLSIKDAITSESYATTSKGGVVKVLSTYGTNINDGVVTTFRASNADIDAKTHQYRPIVPLNLDYAVKTGVTTNTITLTSTEQKAAQDWLGVTDLVGDVETLINAL